MTKESHALRLVSRQLLMMMLLPPPHSLLVLHGQDGVPTKNPLIIDDNLVVFSILASLHRLSGAVTDRPVRRWSDFAFKQRKTRTDEIKTNQTKDNKNKKSTFFIMTRSTKIS